jgi:hypothetical protein
VSAQIHFVTFAVVAGLLALVALTACYLPRDARHGLIRCWR